MPKPKPTNPIAEVPVVWFEQLLEIKRRVADKTDEIEHIKLAELFGYIESAESIIEIAKEFDS